MTAVVVHGDCLEADLPATAPALVYADPPFGSGGTRIGKAGGYDDRLTGPEYEAWLIPRLRRWASTVSDGWFCLHHDPVAVMPIVAALTPDLGAPFGVVTWQDAWVSGFRSRATAFWPRVHDSLVFWRFGSGMFSPTLEPAPASYRRRGGGGATDRPVGDVWVGPWSPGHLSFSGEKVGWPDQKPLALLERVIAATTMPGDLVVDPFCGSGSTLVAACAAGRSAYGVELTADGVAVARGRLDS